MAIIHPHLDDYITRLAREAKAMGSDDMAMRRLLTRFGARMELQVKKNIRDHGLIQDGALINSIRNKTSYARGTWTLLVGSFGVKYARIHELGTVGKGGVLPDIVPKNVQWLTIPQAEWAKKRRAREFNLVRIGRHLVDPQRLRVGESFDPNLDGEAIGFLLAKRARIPPRPYLRPGVEKLLPELAEALRVYYLRRLRGD